MAFDTVLAVVMVAVLAILALLAAAPGSVGAMVRGGGVARGRRADDTRSRLAVTATTDADPDHDAVRYLDLGEPSDLRPAALDRIIRVGTWVFLFAVTTIVAVTDLWGDRQGPILVLLALAGIYTFVLHEVIPPQVPDTLLLVVEGTMGILFVVALIALTGGAQSPFFFALPLIVVGAATVIPPSVTLALTAGAAVAYLIAVTATATATGVDDAWLATVGVNLTALGLIAYVGMAVGREQRRAREDANRLATVDPLTGLRTRPYLFNALERELARSQRTGRAFCLLMVDMDDLKGINDRLGHLAGDRALRTVADVVQARTRRIDTTARFGGDEYVVLLPETDATGGWVLAEKIREGVATAGLEIDGQPVATSVSIGIVTCPEDGDTIRGLLERADEAMYRSKRAGRDRTTGVPVMDPAAMGGGVAGVVDERLRAGATPSPGGPGNPV